MPKLIQRLITLLLFLAIVPHVSNVGGQTREKPVNLAARFGRLRRGVNLSHWFSQAANYSKTHLETHTTAQDIALIKSMGFDHVRFPIEPAPLLSDTPDPAILNTTYLGYIDSALDMILATGLAVIIDIHPSDEFKLRMARDERGIEAFRKFWRGFASHLALREKLIPDLALINEWQMRAKISRKPRYYARREPF